MIDVTEKLIEEALVFMEFRLNYTNSEGIALFTKVGLLDVYGEYSCIRFVFLVGDSGFL